jgi:uncharacterized protein DUF4375
MTWSAPQTPVLDRTVKTLFRRLSRVGNDPRRLPVADQTVIAVYGAQGVIDNGGFRYFFESDWPCRPPYSMFSEAYRRIGAVAAARALDQAVDLFPFARPHLARRRRNEFMDALHETDRFFRLDRRVCGDVGVWEKLERFVEVNEDVLRKRPDNRRRRTRAPTAKPRAPRR